MIFEVSKEDRHKSGVYMILNIKNKKFYIGSTQDFNKRFYSHNGKCKNQIHANYLLQKSVNKYGSENFKFFIIEKVEDLSKIVEREQYYMDKLKPTLNIFKIARKDYYFEVKKQSKPNSEELKKMKCIHCATSKLKESEVLDIIDMLNNKISFKEILFKYPISKRSLDAIKRGESYKHLSYLIVDKESKLCTPFVEKDILEIIRRLNNGDTYASIASNYNVTSKCIEYIHKKKRWKKYSHLIL